MATLRGTSAISTDEENLTFLPLLPLLPSFLLLSFLQPCLFFAFAFLVFGDGAQDLVHAGQVLHHSAVFPDLSLSGLFLNTASGGLKSLDRNMGALEGAFQFK